MDKKSLIDIITLFRSMYDYGYRIKMYDRYDEVVFSEVIHNIQSIYNINLTDEELSKIKRKVDSEFQIYQPDGVALLENYDHESTWYTEIKDNIHEFYWKRYREYLFNQGWALEILNKLEYNTLDNLMNYLGDPNSNESFSRKGLVMGDVQSGKTSNYIGLICKAVDAGYKVIVLLTGTMESLRRQTQIRVEEGFIGWDVENKKWVGVGNLSSDEEPKIPKSATSRLNDFTGTAGESTLLQFNNDKIPYIFITKKNPTTLEKIRKSISNMNLIPPAKQIKGSLLVIDDEADNASINTNSNEYDPTKINSEIRNLINLFTKSNYVGFTATPFANVFIDPENEHEMLLGDLFPKDFIYNLNAPSNYYGAKRMFIEKEHQTIQLINDFDETFPLDHKKDWSFNSLFPSLKNAINTFLIANTIRDIREEEQKNSHRSMLINISRFTRVQEKIEEIVERLLSNIINAIKYSFKLDFSKYIKNSYIKDLYDCFYEHYSSMDGIDWSTILECIYDSVKDIKIYKVPAKDKRKKLNYEAHKEKGLRAIVIGGLALSRGLTLEGLTISYLYRNTATFDVLMQMGRWFGYRDRPTYYEDLCKVWMLEDTKKYFVQITDSILELKQDIEDMVNDRKGPKEFGVRVRNESDILGITNRNKMRTTKKYVYESDYFGQVLETPYISARKEDIENNMKVINDLVSKNNFKYSDKSLFLQSIEMDSIIDLLTRINIHDANIYNYFEKTNIIDFIKENKYEKFDLVIINGDGKNIEYMNYSINSPERSFDLLDDETIRISGKHRRLGGTTDTKHGLTSEEIKSINASKPSSKSFLIEERNPIFMVYPLSLKKTTENIIEKNKINELVDKLNIESLVPYGFAVGFPNSKGYKKSNKKVYFINYNTMWYELMKRKDNEEDD